MTNARPFASLAVLAMLAATPLAAQTPLQINRSVEGALTQGDARMADGDRMDCHLFNAPAGSYRINLESNDFHPFLLAGPGTDCASGSRHASAGSDGRSAELRVRVEAGPWFVRVAPARVGQLGAYRLRVTSLEPAVQAPAPDGLQLSRNQACGYRPGSGRLVAAAIYRDAVTARPSDYIQLDGRAVRWSQSGFVEAAARPWFRESAEIPFGGATYGKYGLPRALFISELQVVGEYDGQAVMSDLGATDHELIYVLVKGLECSFQPYVRQDD